MGESGLDLYPEDSNQWWALMNIVMNLQLPYNVGIPWVVKQLLASQERPSSMELVMVLCEHSPERTEANDEEPQLACSIVEIHVQLHDMCCLGPWFTCLEHI